MVARAPKRAVSQTAQVSIIGPVSWAKNVIWTLKCPELPTVGVRKSLHDDDALEHVHAAREGDVTGFGGDEFDHDSVIQR